MAVDEAILLCHAERSAPPTLRFYDWSPACISLGRFQKWPFEGEPPFEVVRRPTGGRGVLHRDEITYCAVLREDLLPEGSCSVVGAYRWLSEGFIAGLGDLGIGAQMGKGETCDVLPDDAVASAPVNDVNCFAASARCDLTVAGRKLIGAAQCRKRGAVLQHGAILLDYDVAAWSALGLAPQAVTSLHALGIFAPRDQLIKHLSAGVERSLGIKLRISGLSERELEVAQALHNEKYARATWTRDATDVPTAASEPLQVPTAG